MKTVFFDTWAWIAMANGKDVYHEKAMDFYREFNRQGGAAVTTDYVLAETFSALRKALNNDEALRFGRVLLKNIEKGKIRLEFIDEALFSRTWQLCEKFRDKPGISFFDMSSVAVMEKMGMKEIFTGDRDFERINEGYILCPGV